MPYKKMKLIYAPSGKRIIPYPPVGINVLKMELNKENINNIELIDLEIILWNLHLKRRDILIFNKDTTPLDALKKNNFRNQSGINKYYKELNKILNIKEGDEIGISIMGYEQLFSTLLIIKIGLEKRCRVILGGQYINENSLKEILSLFSNPNLTAVVGDGSRAIIYWKKNNVNLTNNCFRLIKNNIISGKIEENSKFLPIPNFENTKWDYYLNYSNELYKNHNIKAAHLFINDKHCPYKCNFCRVSHGNKIKIHPIQEIIKVFIQLVQSEVKNINLIINELNISYKFLKLFLEELNSFLPKDHNISWFTYLRGDKIHKKDFEKLKQVGCKLVRWGVESGSQRILNKMNKDLSIKIIKENLRLSSDAGIFNHVNFMVGYPGETDDDIEKTIFFISEMKDYIHSVRINPFYVPPGTYLAENPEKYGIKLIKFKSGYWDFKLLEGETADTIKIKNNINKMCKQLSKQNIGYVGVDPFFLINILSKFDKRDDALKAMKEDYAFLWEKYSSEKMKSLIGKYYVKDNLDNVILKRGKNYNLSICYD